MPIRKLLADEYYLCDDAFDGNDEQIDGLKERLQKYRAIAERSLTEPTVALDELVDILSDTVEVDANDLPDFWFEKLKAIP